MVMMSLAPHSWCGTVPYRTRFETAPLIAPHRAMSLATHHEGATVPYASSLTTMGLHACRWTSLLDLTTGRGSSFSLRPWFPHDSLPDLEPTHTRSIRASASTKHLNRSSLRRTTLEAPIFLGARFNLASYRSVPYCCCRHGQVLGT
jgi:hypothetical protein